MVDARRSWPTVRVLGEFERWSRLVASITSVSGRGPVGGIGIPFGNLGRYPTWMLASTLVFDWHTHLHHDIAPALGKPPRPPDECQLAATLEWMLAGLQQMNRPDMRWVDRPVTLTLKGLAGGSWDIEPAGGGLLSVTPATGRSAAAEIVGDSIDFPAWATTRVPWRDADLEITGDHDYAARFLDAVNII
jgi:hypothetical protein